MEVKTQKGKPPEQGVGWGAREIQSSKVSFGTAPNHSCSFARVHKETRAGEAKNNSDPSLDRVKISHVRCFAVSQNKLKSMNMGR